MLIPFCPTVGKGAWMIETMWMWATPFYCVFAMCSCDPHFPPLLPSALIPKNNPLNAHLLPICPSVSHVPLLHSNKATTQEAPKETKQTLACVQMDGMGYLCFMSTLFLLFLLSGTFLLWSVPMHLKVFWSKMRNKSESRVHLATMSLLS